MGISALMGFFGFYSGGDKSDKTSLSIGNNNETNKRSNNVLKNKNSERLNVDQSDKEKQALAIKNSILGNINNDKYANRGNHNYLNKILLTSRILIMKPRHI